MADFPAIASAIAGAPRGGAEAMLGGDIRLFRLFGIVIKVNLSWGLLAILIAWALATGFFPALHEGLSRSAYWGMSAGAVAGLFVSIVAHELAHSLVARRFGMPMRSITLFALGGVAEMEAEPPSPRAEFAMALAGPLMSVALAAAFHAGDSLLTAGQHAVPLAGVLHYLALLNLVLAGFNMVPAFPLDGGRALRALLWQRSGDFRRATARAGRIGALFGVALAAFGLATILLGDLVVGLWWVLLGLFIRGAALGSALSVEFQYALGAEPVRRFMTRDPATVTAETRIASFVEDHVLASHHDAYPVVRGRTPIGVMTTRALAGVPRAAWPTVTVGEAMTPADDTNTIAADARASDALQRMQAGGLTRLMVVESGTLVGVLSMRDLLHALALRSAVEQAR